MHAPPPNRRHAERVNLLDNCCRVLSVPSCLWCEVTYRRDVVVGGVLIVARASRPCATDGCHQLVQAGQTWCGDCDRARERVVDERRGTAAQRGYGSRGHRRFRRLVLARDPICVLCGSIATEADHWPMSRRDLVAAGLDPNDPVRGRGLCKVRAAEL